MGAEPARDAVAIVLAAGRASRLGTPKALVRVEGAPWIARQLASLAAAGVARAVVVLGHAWEAHVRELDWAAERLRDAGPVLGLSVRVVRNVDPDRGPFSSLQLAADAVGGASAWVLPIDVPCAGAPVFRALEGAIAGADASAPVYAGRGGHPVLLAPPLVARVRDADASTSRLDALLARADVRRVPVDDARVAMNLNTEEDWRAFRITR